MSGSDEDTPQAAPSTDLDPSEFPSLEGFFLGYLHEDFEIVHGSPEGAMDAFVAEAGAEDQWLVAREWAVVRARLASLDEAHRLVLLGGLGMAWQPSTWSEVEALFDRLASALAEPEAE